MLQSINPTTGLKEYECEEMSDEALEGVLSRTISAFASWSAVSLEDRSRLMRRLGALLRESADPLSELMAREMGKIRTAGGAEVEKCALVCDFYADNAASMLAPEQVPSTGSQSFVRFDPLGALLAVMPWNFPFWQVFRFAAPALMAGNVGLLKHASSVPQCSQAIEKLFRDAGFPDGVFQNLLIGSGRVERVVADDRIAAVTLTGSEAAGSRVAAVAGKALKKSVLELGGSDPFVVFADADMDAAVRTAVTARLQNCGQSCIAAKRFIVDTTLYDRFVERLTDAFEAIRVGDPLDDATELGPLASQQQVDEISRQVTESVARGAKLRAGGCRLERPGFFYQPTVLSDVRPGMNAYDEELFGPVASVIRAEDEEDAIRIANDTAFGLGASLWTRDTQRATRLAERIMAGCVFINGMVKSDPRVPFGGVKKSGYGRELSRYGLLEFVNIKTVWIAE